MKKNPLCKVHFSNCTFETIKDRAFHFSSPKVTLSIDTTSEIFHLNCLAFYGPSVQHLKLNQVILSKFSSQDLSELPSNAIVEITNSVISQGYGGGRTHPKSIALTSIQFKNVKFQDIYEPFLDIGAKEDISFVQCQMTLIQKDQIRLSARQVIFEGCDLKLQGEETLKITADWIELKDCYLNQPQQKALLGLTSTPDSPDSRLVLHNLRLDDPAKGTLQTRVSKLENLDVFNVTVDSCDCHVAHDLACRKDFELDHDRLMPTLSCQELKSVLMNNTFCK